jgi:hypothetical protein
MEIITTVLAIVLLSTGIVMWIKGEGKRKGIGIGIVMALLITGVPEFIEGYGDEMKEGFVEGFEN